MNVGIYYTHISIKVTSVELFVLPITSLLIYCHFAIEELY